MVGVGLGELRKGENDSNELSMKKENLLAVQITIELVDILGITPETSCNCQYKSVHTVVLLDVKSQSTFGVCISTKCIILY